MNLTTLLLSLALLLAPGRVGKETREIIEATVYAVEHDTDEPIFRSREADAVVMLYTAWAESRFRLHPPCVLGRCDHGRSHGAWQVQRPEGQGTARAQAAIALRMMHWAASACPDLPMAAYLSGSCKRARSQAGERMNDLARTVFRLGEQGVAEMQATRDRF